jgi:transporter family protein
MPEWVLYSCLVIVLWGVVGLFQKLGTNLISAHTLMVWLTLGYLLLIPILLARTGLGAWYLFASLEAGAKASIAVPLTALNPLLTIVLALAFLGERLTLMQWGGIVAALIAGVMISYEAET